LGKGSTERFGSEGGRTDRLAEAAWKERELRKEMKEKGRRKSGGRTGIGGRALASLMPYYSTRASVMLVPCLSMWRGPGFKWIPRALPHLVSYYSHRASVWMASYTWVQKIISLVKKVFQKS
jgi:hypothetical protein